MPVMISLQEGQKARHKWDLPEWLLMQVGNLVLRIEKSGAKTKYIE
jgi:hypothetical protein